LLAGSWRALLVTGLFTSTALLLLAIPDTHGSLFDFRGGLYNAGRDIIHGQSPYQPAFLAHQVAIMRAKEIGVGETVNNPFSIPVYPAFAKLAVVPLSLLPFWLAGTLYTVLSIAAMIVGLGLLGVRDWRCIALALVSWPFTFGLYLGALGPFLLLGAAIAWHWRSRLWPPAIAIALLVSAKVFPWPLGIWLLITRRFRTLALAMAIGIIVTLAAWAAIGFDGIAQYPQMLSNLSFIQEGRAVSLAAVLIAIGLSAGAAGIVALAAAGASWPRVAVRQAPRRGAHGIRPRHHRRSHRHPNRLGALHGPPVYPDRADLTPAVGDLVPPALHTHDHCRDRCPGSAEHQSAAGRPRHPEIGHTVARAGGSGAGKTVRQRLRRPPAQGPLGSRPSPAAASAKAT